MGVKSTRTVTRKQAIEWILADVSNCTDKSLGIILELVSDDKGDHFTNFEVSTPYRPEL